METPEEKKNSGQGSQDSKPTPTRATRKKVTITEEPIGSEDELIEELEIRLTDSTYRQKAETVVFAFREMARLASEGKIKLE